MLFEKEKYYQYIKTLEGIMVAKYILIAAIGITTGIATKNILAILLALIISYISTLLLTINIKIKIQKMKLDIDIATYIKENQKGH